MELGNQIRKYRTDLKLSQDDLAEKVFVTRQTISNWENNRNYPDIRSLVLLSNVFGVSLDILVKGDLEQMKDEIKAEDIVSACRHDKKMDGKHIKFILLKQIGEAFIDTSITQEELFLAAEYILTESNKSPSSSAESTK